MYDQLTIGGGTRQQKLYDYSIHVLKIAEPPEGYYVCTSFGKDSIAVQRLCDEAGVKYDAHHNVTGIDPPELVYFGRKYYPDVKREPYSINMWRLIQKKGVLPMRNKRYCCDVLKEDGGHGRRCVMGIRAAESSRRKNSWAPMAETGLSKKERESGKGLRLFEPDDIQQSSQQCVGRSKITVSPMYFWEDDDLWDFIRDRKLPYCSLYDEGFKRLGCIGCPIAGEEMRRHEFERWPGFYRLYMRAIQKLMAAGKYTGIGSAEAVMEWWLSDVTQEKPMEGQLSLDDI